MLSLPAALLPDLRVITYRCSMIAPTAGPASPLSGRCALITGSTGGIGFAVARALAALGCDIRLHGLATDAEAAPALADIAACGVRVDYRRLDLADTAALATLVDAPDILVNNAVSRHFGAIEDMSQAAWDTDLAVNLSAPFHLTRLCLPTMRARGWGRIVNMSSIYGLIGATGRVGYVTTKTALLGLTRATAIETASTGITCNALCPGSTLTPNIAARLDAAMASASVDRAAAASQHLAGKQPSGRFVDAAAVGALAAFLCSDAARDITGAALPIDGGWSAA